MATATGRRGSWFSTGGSLLSEPLSESSAWLDAFSKWSCRNSSDGSCGWYHGTWQYLRMLNLVSNPSWHHAYLCEALPAAVGGRSAPRVMVSGCADYSLFAHAAFALGGRPAFTVLDWCPTPLGATAWYARRAALPAPELLCEDAIAHRPQSGYDLIVSDSFLPRFAPDAMLKLVRGWRESLRDGGSIVTTVRIRERSEAAPGEGGSAAEAWRRKAEAAGRHWDGLSTLPHAELVERVAYFAEHQERTVVYGQHELEEILRGGGFDRVDCRIVDIDGKRFARITAA
ncbi:hypothetical protein ACQP2P_15490 [Dactylosporangium sp. CA-139114]|uniref:hypothetical protein n=1 Tax=Dactylosporangium sp. CA-139114 TaxID=3239931 RepID=UPI003D98999F